MKLLCEVLGVRKNEVTRLFLGLRFFPFSRWFSSSPLEATGFREACQDSSILLTLGKFVLECFLVCQMGVITYPVSLSQGQ